MNDLYASQGKFQLNKMSDAEEALDEILKWLHCDQVGGTTTSVKDVACMLLINRFYSARPLL
jgi:hypothetical protein